MVSVVNLSGHTPTIIQSVVIYYLLHCSISLVILCAVVFRSSCSSATRLQRTAFVTLSSSISFCIYCTVNSILQSPIALKNLQDVQRWRSQNLSYRLPSVSALSSSADVGLCGLKFFIVIAP